MRLCKALWVVIGLAVPATAGCGDAVGVREGARAPAFALPAEDGSVVRSDALQGQPVLVTFWSTTCGPCVKEIPELQQIDDGRRVKVVGVALDPGGWAAVRPFVERHRITYRVLLGGEEVFQRFDGYALPYSVLLDGSQRVVKVYRGAVTKAAVERDARAAAGG
jgi:peroxiredoxin